MSTEKKKSCTLHLQTLMGKQMGGFPKSRLFSVLTFVIIWLSAFYTNPQQSLGPKYLNINQKYLHKMTLTNN